MPERLDGAGLEVQQRDAQIPEAQQIEIRRAAPVGHERDGLAVGRPRGVEIGEFIVGEPAQPGSVSIDNEEIGEAVAEAGEDELRPVWRPLRRLQPVQADVDAAIFPAALHVENHQVIAVLTLGRDREVAAVGRERSRRIDEAQALVVVVLRRFHQSALDASGLGVRQPEIDEEAALISEVCNVLAIRRQRRRQEDAPARVPLG